MNRIPSVIILGIALVLLFTTVFGNHGLLHLLRLNQELAELDSKNRELQSDIAAIRQRLDSLRNDPAVLESLAREELGLSRPGEILYVFDGSASHQSQN